MSEYNFETSLLEKLTVMKCKDLIFVKGYKVTTQSNTAILAVYDCANLCHS